MGQDAEAQKAPLRLDPAIDRAAAAEFLQAVLRESKDPAARVEAAEMLTGLGVTPDAEGLLGVLKMRAGQPQAGVPAGGRVAPGPGFGPPGPRPGMGAPGMPGMAGMPSRAGMPLPGAGTRQPALTEETLAELQRRAVELLEAAAGPELAPKLRELAQKGKSMVCRAGAIRVLARVAGEEDMAYLEELAGPARDRYADVRAAAERMHLREAAVKALAAAGRPEAVSYMLELWFEAPPAAEDFVTPPAAKALKRLLKERAESVPKAVCEAALALPPGWTLYGAAPDKARAEELIEQIRAEAEKGAVAQSTAPAAQERTALAIRALGRAGRLSPRAWQTMRALASGEVPMPPGLIAAVADALVSIGTSSATNLLSVLRPRMQETPELKDQWQKICLRLVARGRQADYLLIGESLTDLPEELVQRLVSLMAERKDTPPQGYFELLARIAARPVRTSYVEPADFYSEALKTGGKVKPRREERPAGVAAMPPRPGMLPQGLPPRPGMAPPSAPPPPPKKPRSSYRGGWGVRAGTSSRTIRKKRRTAARKKKQEARGKKVAPLRAPTLPPDPRAEELKLRARCFELLARGPKRMIVATLLDPRLKLTKHDLLGPWVAGMLHRHDPSYDIASYLKERFQANISLDDRRAVIATARQVGTQAARQFLAEILLARPAGADEEAALRPPAARKRDEQAQPEPPGVRGVLRMTPEERARLARQAATERKKKRRGAGRGQTVVMKCVARALGSLGDYASLRKAVTYRYDGEKVKFVFPQEVALAAVEGMAYLPPEKQPVECLRRLSQLFRDPDIKGVCAEAMLTAYRLQAERNQ